MIPHHHSSSRHRFNLWAPHLDFLVRSPAIPVFISTVFTLPLLFLSWHWVFLPLFVLQVFVGFRLDRGLNTRLLVPPLGLLAGASFLGFGVGLPMVADASEVTGFDPVLLTMQVVALCSTPMTMLGYCLGRGTVTEDWCPARTDPVFAAVSGPLLKVATFLAIYDVMRMVIGWRSGSLDRGFAGEAILEQNIGVWTFVGLFGRWTNLWFFFVPVLWRFSGALGRAVLCAVFASYAVIAYASGARGLLLYPVIFFFFGIYFFIDRPRFRPERWLLLLLPLFATYIYAVDVFRNTEQFQNSRLSDLGTRLAATSAIRREAEERGDFVFTTGRALLGVADNVVYENTPNPVPFAGASDILPAIMWTWVPQKLAPNKPPLFDSDIIVVSYTNMKSERSASTITLAADCYRRFGWFGVPLGTFLFGIVFGLFVRVTLLVMKRLNVIMGVVLLALLVGGFQTGLSSTLLQTWWIWAYDLPKHLIVSVVVVFFLSGGVSHGMDLYRDCLSVSLPTSPTVRGVCRPTPARGPLVARKSG